MGSGADDERRKSVLWLEHESKKRRQRVHEIRPETSKISELEGTEMNATETELPEMNTHISRWCKTITRDVTVRVDKIYSHHDHKMELCPNLGSD